MLRKPSAKTLAAVFSDPKKARAIFDMNRTQLLETEAGETYAPTVIYWRGQYRVQSVGDFIETMQRQGVRFI